MLNIYRASAGSGKTYQLTNEFITRLFEDTRRYPHRRIMAVTFTNKATDEMRTRIVDALYQLAKNQNSDLANKLVSNLQITENEIVAKSRQVLFDILHDYHFFAVSTIDRFFQQILRAFAREIGIAGNYNIELDTTLVLQQAADNLMINLAQPENSQLLEWLTDIAENMIEEGQSWNIQRKMLNLGKEIFSENFQNQAAQTNEKLYDKVFLKNYSNKLKEIIEEYDENVKFKAKNILLLMKKFDLQHEDFSHSRTKKFEQLLENTTADVGKRILEMREVENCYTKKSPAKDKIEFAYANGMRMQINDLLDFIEKNIPFRNSSAIILKYIGNLGIITDLSLEIKKLMNEQDSFLLSDTNLLLNKIIADSDSPFIYEKAGIFINHFMIDEFQDTSVLQWKNFKPLIHNSLASGNTEMLVGDVKQSIYRWRNSDWQLLDEQVANDFRQEQIREFQLNTNWRSDKNIVEFNNQLFSIAPKILYNELKDNILNNNLDAEKYNNTIEKITNAYRDVNQHFSPKAQEGHVRFEFLDDTKDTERSWRDESLKRLPKLLEDLQLRGFQPDRVCVLVRKNTEAQLVVQRMLEYKHEQPVDTEYCYDIIGNEGLTISSAPVVRFIINALHLIQNPENRIARKIVEQEFANVISPKMEITLLNAKFNKISTLPLFEMIETIVSLFELGNWQNAAVFIQNLQDIVYQFAVRKSASLNDFLAWWTEHGVKKTVAVPDTQRAFRIMTVHKAKGLDFDAVIMPFADWEMETAGVNADILWCKTDIDQFAELPIFPVTYGTALKNSIFTAEYYNEKMLQLVDNLNIAYVAFTRPKHELICFAPCRQKSKTSENIKVNSLTLLMLDCLQEENLKNFFDVENKIFEMGQPVVLQRMEKQVSDDEKIDNYPTKSTPNTLKISRKSTGFWQNQPAVARVNFGKIMHELLQKIKTRADQPRTLAEMEMEGKISADEKQKIIAEMEKFWKIPQTLQWFENEDVILNEKTILTPEGKNYRPDRILLNGNHATVIDYKFGEQEKSHYRTQIQQYMDLLAQMNYTCEGLICYVKLQKVEKI
ncbi:DNA helicase [Bacteroidia bacterium]|nr:DNA helicase [Bacteroidia bacterium]GHV43306.1 DNA helicase [Bacteroidia bacterium]